MLETSSVRGRPLWHNILFMTLNPLAALILVPLYIWMNGFSLGLFILFAVCYTISNMSITCGYHRYFSHRSYDVNRLVEWLYVFFGAGAFQGSILAWCSDHRRHHRVVDTNDDPYSINKGFWYAHVLWMFHQDPHPESGVYPKDLSKNRFIQWQHDHYVWIATFVGFILPGLVAWALGIGFWGGVIFGGSLRIVLSQHSTFLINSVVHMFGRQPYTDKNTARDNTLMAFFTFGEGYHNFHHMFQADYRNGIAWYQWDPTKWWIDTLAVMGLARKLKKARKEDILKARLAMEERHILEGGISEDLVTQLKSQLLAAQIRMRQLREDTNAAKLAFRQKREQMSRDMREQMAAQMRRLKHRNKAEIRVAQLEFKTAYSQWREIRRVARRVVSVQAA